MIMHIYSWLIDLYPKEFSRTFKGEMLGIFKERLSEEHQRGIISQAGFLIREGVGLLVSIVKEHSLSQRTRRGEFQMDKHTYRLDPRIRGAIIIGVGFAVSQIMYALLRQNSSNVLEILGSFLTRGLIAFSSLEAISIGIGTYLILEQGKRRRLITSIFIAFAYLIGIALFYKIAIAVGQLVHSDNSIILQFERFGTYAFISLMIGYTTERLFIKSIKPGQITLILGGGFLGGEIFGYGLFILSNVLIGSSPFGPWGGPEYLSMLAIQGLGEGLIVGYSLGYLQAKYFNATSQTIRKDSLLSERLEA